MRGLRAVRGGPADEDRGPLARWELTTGADVVICHECNVPADGPSGDRTLDGVTPLGRGSFVLGRPWDIVTTIDGPPLIVEQCNVPPRSIATSVG